MGLRDIPFKKAYSSDSDDILHDFYIPVLSEATEYRRLAGFFSSSSLAIAAKGISGLIGNNGFMKLIVSPKLRKRDLEVLIRSEKEREAFLEEKMLESIDRLEDELVRDHVQALGWMVANKRLEIRIAIMCDQYGNLVSSEDDTQAALFHQKVAILRDLDGNTISFSGSINETARAWLDNMEEFKVFRSWEPIQQEYLDADISKFDRFWNNQSKGVRVTAVSTAVEKKLIELAPDDISEIDLARWYRRRTVKETKWIELYQHQEKAIQSWVNNGMRGILAMATGTGKTFTALGCAEEARRKQERLVVVVVCPKNHLVRQWQREVENFGIDFPKVVADSTNPTWKHELTDRLIDISLGHENNLMILTTYATFPSESFRNIMREQKSDSCYLLIADEVHWLGAEKSREGLGDEYELRLGLSATPKRWMDIAGTKAIYNYFSEDVYEFPLEEAIYTINPTTGWSYLVHYRYVPKFVSLTNTEVQEYYESSKKISKMFHGSERDDREDLILENMFYKRADIVKDAEEKYKVLEQLMDELGSDIRWTIIYCTPKQMDKTMDIVYHAGITMRHSFTMNEGVKPEKKYGGLSERDDILKKFAEGDYRERTR